MSASRRSLGSYPLLVLAVPFVLARATTWLTGVAPSVIVAAPQPMNRQLVQELPELAELTDAQRRAISWQESAPTNPQQQNPFAREEAVVEAPKGPDPETEASRFVVSSVLGRGRGAMASINQRIFKIGDELDESWRVVSIDSVRRTVTVEHTDGVQVELSAR